MRSQSPINIAITLLLSLKLVLLRAKKGSPRFIGYQNLINDRKKLVASQTDGGLVVRRRTRDQGVSGSNPAWTVGFFLAKIVPHCSSSPRCINGYPDRAVAVQV